jgi:hypothetical protein
MSNNHHKFQVNRLLTPSELHQFLDVNFEEGILYWKKRDREFFTSDRSANVWNAKHAGKEALGSAHIDGYRQGNIFSKLYLAHRVIYALKHGEWPNFIDHINGNRSDNKISNLRSVTKSENSCNARKPNLNKSGHIGVSWNARDKRWTAYITLNRKRKALGNFVNFEEAVACRKQSQASMGFHPNHGR